MCEMWWWRPNVDYFINKTNSCRCCFRFVANRNNTHAALFHSVHRSMGHNIQARAHNRPKCEIFRRAHKTNAKTRWEKKIATLGGQLRAKKNIEPKLSANTHTLSLPPSCFAFCANSICLYTYDVRPSHSMVYANVFTSPLSEQQPVNNIRTLMRPSAKQNPIEQLLVRVVCCWFILLNLIVFLDVFFFLFAFIYGFPFLAERIPSHRETNEDATKIYCREMWWGALNTARIACPVRVPNSNFAFWS